MPTAIAASSSSSSCLSQIRRLRKLGFLSIGGPCGTISRMAVHLTDMEELVGRIVSSEARDYMSESLKCYQAGAFRACVVLSYIALFDDLRRKLAPLAVLNSKAKEIHEEIEKKAKDQEVFESLFADKLSSVNMIDAGQKSK